MRAGDLPRVYPCRPRALQSCLPHPLERLLLHRRRQQLRDLHLHLHQYLRQYRRHRLLQPLHLLQLLMTTTTAAQRAQHPQTQSRLRHLLVPPHLNDIYTNSTADVTG